MRRRPLASKHPREPDQRAQSTRRAARTDHGTTWAQEELVGPRDRRVAGRRGSTSVGGVS